MRITMKVLATPLMVTLSILLPLLVFIFVTAKVALSFLSGLAIIVAVALFVMRNVVGGIVFTVIALLISPIGIPVIAEWGIAKLYRFNYFLKDFIRN